MLRETWDNDQLNRKFYSQVLRNYLVGKFKASQENHRDESFVLNINAEWGFGKTYFLSNWRDDLVAEEFPVIYFDAWKNDFSEDSLLAFIVEIDNQLKPLFGNASKAKKLVDNTINSAKKIFSPSSPAVAAILTRKLLGLSAQELNDLLNRDEDFSAIQEDDLETENGPSEKFTEEVISTVVSKAAEQALKSHRNKKRSIIDFKKSLMKLTSHIDKKLKAKKLPLFILVDELDRCRPSYAIELLENIKHLFGVRGVYFIIATDSTQLAHSIEAIYGSKFDSNRYLRRFFDQEYTLPEPDNLNFSEFLLQRNLSVQASMFSPLETQGSYSGLARLMALYSTFFNLSLRDQEQAFCILEAITLFYAGQVIHLGMIFIFIALRLKYRSFFEIVNSSGGVIEQNTWSEFLSSRADLKKDIKYDDIIWQNNNHGSQGSTSVPELISEYIRLSSSPLLDVIRGNVLRRESSRNIVRKLSKEINCSLHYPYTFSGYIKMVKEASQFS
jgi:hypothetical protein